MIYLKIFEKWINTDKEIKKYLVLKCDFENRFNIMKVVSRFTENKVDSVELERVHLFDLSTGKDINDDLNDNYIYTSNYVINNILQQLRLFEAITEREQLLNDATSYIKERLGVIEG